MAAVLLINGNAPDAATRTSLVSYEAAYDGPARLTFRCDADWRSQPFGRDAAVELVVDGVRRFVGLLNGPGPTVYAENQRFILYEAVDGSDLAARKFPKNQYGNYAFALNPGRLEDVIAQWLSFAEVTELLEELGFDAETVYEGGAEAVYCFPVSLNAASLDAGFRAIAAAAPGVGLLLDCTSERPRYRFVYAYGAAVYDLALDRTRLEKLEITETIEGRGGAVQTLAGSTTGEAEVTLDQRHVLTPAWGETPEARLEAEQRWHHGESTAADENGAPHPRSEVFRRFSFAGAESPPTAGTAVAVEIRVLHSDDDPEADVWRKVDVLPPIDFENQTILLKEPAVRPATKNAAQQSKLMAAARFNIHEPGRCANKAARVRICYSSEQTGHAQINIPSIRHPEVGYAGRVSQLYPERGATVVTIVVPPGVDRAAWVPYAFAQISEPGYSGEIPIVGELPAELWGLGRRVNLISVDRGRTGYEDLLAPVMAIRVEFAPNAPRASVQLSRDTTKLLQEAAS